MSKQDREVHNILQRYASGLPRFPDGRVDYSHAACAPVVSVFVKYCDAFLLLKRSDRVRTYKGKWNTVAGYIDDPKPLRQKALEELQEEAGISEEDIAEVRLGEPFEVLDRDIGKTWIVHPILVGLKAKPEIRLDWEHTDFAWVRADEIGGYDIVPNLAEGLKRTLK